MSQPRIEFVQVVRGRQAGDAAADDQHLGADCRAGVREVVGHACMLSKPIESFGPQPEKLAA